MKEIESEFVFALTNTGSESALKHEVESMELGWRPSYQHRGFVTFKAASKAHLFSLGSLDHELACARRLCLSLGKSESLEEAKTKIRVHPAFLDGTIHHLRHLKWKLVSEEEKLTERPEIGECIGTVVELGPTQFWAGLHLHGPYVSPDPGGDSQIEMPAHSPSRAWLKLEEAVRFFNLQFTRNDIVVELGCAPGGVVLALLERGIPVVGVDPALMADVVMESAIFDRREAPDDKPWFFHCKKPAALAGKRDLSKVTWFMSDMNQAPEVVLKECERFCEMSRTIRNALITMKVTNLTQISEKQKWIDALKEMRFKSIRVQQLAVHNKEFVVLATR